MCGISFLVNGSGDRLERMIAVQRHRGPDYERALRNVEEHWEMGHNRLSIIDLSPAAHQPMCSPERDTWIAFNGEIYNYVELRRELRDYDYRSQSDTEVLLAAYERWGEGCLSRLIGMFAFVIWDGRKKKLVAARDRFGVKPLFYHQEDNGGLVIASEIKALHAAGVPRKPDAAAWATYLERGMYDHGVRTFWEGIHRLPPGGRLTWTQKKGVAVDQWYDLSQVLGQGEDTRPDEEVAEELTGLLEDSVKLRFRADVPVGICLSGGVDSSLLLGLVHRLQGTDSEVQAFTFYFGSPEYDETPWVEKALAHTRHPLHLCHVAAADVPRLVADVQRFQDEPFGGFPTLGMHEVHRTARREGVKVLLDGNGIDEAWAGYDYYRKADSVDYARGPVQGSCRNSRTRSLLKKEFAAWADVPSSPAEGEMLRALQYRDISSAKIPRALRFNDRVSMMHSRELREPFLDHRIVELGLRQPAARKIRNGLGKWLVRQVARRLLPGGLVEAPKRPVQTPQREWLRDELAEWAESCIEGALAGWGKEWLDGARVRSFWESYRKGGADNSFPLWQLISINQVEQNCR